MHFLSSRIERNHLKFTEITVDDVVNAPKIEKYESGNFTSVTSSNNGCAHAVPEDWYQKEYREAIVEAGIEQDIAWQILNNRQKRKWTQRQLAERLGTQQSAVRRLEDPEYGRHSLNTLVKVAHAFDCALQVRLLPFSEFAEISNNLSPEATFAASFIEEFTNGSEEEI
ncbi:hypothetical protein P608_24895 [Comamonas thiooxydans]|uniref:HTH cro/C1-type domain-containing protein n=2 Tax=Comamonas thiooxydans TaxID=363952 RepID=A0A0E3BU20_9BURK|nr:hypothetical protein P608_24895 [Comamonas thiooxydans]KGH17667.1 hypothetical protein P606_26150 [Comamonas thiooxydans]KGH27963.1 hypothetical protein P607_02995 [Comamonas thiooxydans]